MSYAKIKLQAVCFLLSLSLSSCNIEQLSYQGSEATAFKGIDSVEYEGTNLFTARWLPLQMSGSLSIKYEFYSGTADSLNQTTLTRLLGNPTKTETIQSGQEKIQMVTLTSPDLAEEIYLTEPKNEIGQVSEVRFSLNMTAGKTHYIALRAKVGGELRDSDSYENIYLFTAVSNSFNGIESIKVSAETNALQLNWSTSEESSNNTSTFYQTSIWSPTSSAFESYIDSLTSDPISSQARSETTQNGWVRIYTIEDEQWLPKNNATSTESVFSTNHYTLTQPLALDKTHAFQVEIANESSVKNRVAIISFLTSPLDGFTGLTSAQKIDSETVQLNWQVATNTEVTSYNIYRGTNFATLVDTVDQNISTFSVSGLSGISTETFGIKATDAYGHEDSNLSLISVVLQGAESVTSPELKVVPSSHDFSQVKAGGTAGSETFTILNSGNTTNLNSFSVSGSDSFSISEDNCSGQTLVQDASCTLTVSFAPDNLGVASATVASKFTVVDDNLIEWDDFSFAVTGEGVANINSFTGVNGYVNLDKTSVDITWDADSLASQYGVYKIENGNRSLLQTVTAPATGANLSGLNYATSYTIQVFAIDSTGLLAENDASIAFTTLSEPSFIVSRLGEIGNNQYQYSWINTSTPSGSTFTISKKIGSTAPTAIDVNETVVSGLADTVTSYTSSTSVGGSGDIFPVSFTLFTCSNGSCSASYSVTLDGGITSIQNDSEGSTFKLEYSTSGGQTPVLGWSTSRSTVEGWNGIDSVSGLEEIASGATNCTSPSTTGCSVDLSSDTAWNQNYFRLSVPSTDGRSAYLSDIFTYAKVPDGMVYIDASSWTVEEGLTYEDHETFSFAIDKYEVDSNYQSLESSTPLVSIGWPTFKSGCSGRTATGFTSSEPWRTTHMQNGLEYTAASYGTPDTGGQGYCNVDSRGTPAAANETGTNDNSGCISYFGARNMIGNVWEFSDEILDERNWKIFYATSAEEAIPVPIISETSGTVYVQDWNRQTAMTSYGTRSGPWSASLDRLTQDWGVTSSMSTSSEAKVVLRGGEWSESFSAGRFRQYLSWSAVNTGNNVGGRCAILSPGPGRIQFQNDSSGSLARFRWRLWAEEAITTVKIGFATTLAGIEAWDGTDQGSSISDDLYTINNYSGCTDTSYNSTHKTTSGDGSTTSGTFSLTGRCGLNLSGLTAWEKRYVKLYASNSYGTTTSSTLVYGKVPDGMVFVSSDDWPDKDKHQTANEIGEEYSSPFDFAVDKYSTSANGTVNNCTSDDFPCTSGIGGGYLESAATTYAGNLNWYTHKAGCDARTTVIGSTWADTSALPGSTTGRRVHLITGLEHVVAGFETPDATGPGFCMFDSTFWNPTNNTNQSTEDYQNCISRYGASVMLGTSWQMTNDILHNTKLISFYDDTTGSGEDVGLELSWGPSNGVATSWSFDKAVPMATSSTVSDGIFGIGYFTTNGLASTWGAKTRIQLRGGRYSEGSKAGRFALYQPTDPTATNGYWSGRCALRAP